MNKIHLTTIFSREFAKFYQIEWSTFIVFVCLLVRIATDLVGLISEIIITLIEHSIWLKQSNDFSSSSIFRAHWFIQRISSHCFNFRMLGFFVEFICLVCLGFIAVAFQFKINFHFSNCERVEWHLNFEFREIWREVFGGDMNTQHTHTPNSQNYWNEKCRNWNEMALCAWKQNANALMFANKLGWFTYHKTKTFVVVPLFVVYIVLSFRMFECVCVWVSYLYMSVRLLLFFDLWFIHFIFVRVSFLPGNSGCSRCSFCCCCLLRKKEIYSY